MIDGREQNELQFSMRSVMTAMSASVETVHLVVADLYTSSSSRFSDSRSQYGIAQTPSWLDFGRVGCGRDRPRLQLSTHYEIFHLPSLQAGEEQKELQWREQAIPTFNSKAIESRIGWLPGLVRLSDLHDSR
jgi:3-O-alpha-D-mannopyranosyl-alpha-D-mannopyranose xylosylphosphotransferase